MPMGKGCSASGRKVVVIHDDSDTSGRARLRFWEIEHYFKCPVVGMCLTLSEQKQLLKRTGFSVKKAGAFEIHEILVANSENENRLSRRVDSLLNRKYGNEARTLLDLDREEFMTRFRADFEAGDTARILWAAAARPDLPVELRREIFGQVHMAMHWNGEQSAKIKQKLAGQEKELDYMRQKVSETARQWQSLQKERERLQKDRAELKARLAAVERERTELEDTLSKTDGRCLAAELEQENRVLRDKVEALAERLKQSEHQNHLLEDRNAQVSSELDEQRELNMHFTKEIQAVCGDMAALNRCDPACPSLDLCQKRVLIVGGITRMESLYRELVESSGGIFEYHHGYMKKGTKGLESRLRRADVVLCPVSCNSHAACSIVKNLAKKHNKTVFMLANSSLSAVCQAIRGTHNEGGAAVN